MESAYSLGRILHIVNSLPYLQSKDLEQLSDKCSPKMMIILLLSVANHYKHKESMYVHMV